MIRTLSYVGVTQQVGEVALLELLPHVVDFGVDL
jgi:hypothetical protein